jgi:hypothetical protein
MSNKTAGVIWLNQTENAKTGNVPTLYVGTNKQEAWESCEGCALRDENRCYAWNGTVRMGQASLFRSYAADPKRYTFKAAMAKRSPNARMVRLGAIGDPARTNHRALKAHAAAIRKLGMAVVGYTHFHEDKANQGLKGTLMASCNDVAQADKAVARGWRATAIVPHDFEPKRFITPAGNQAIVCPAQTKPGEISCNSCRLCDASRDTPFKVIAFKDHGPQARMAKRAAKKLPVAK